MTNIFSDIFHKYGLWAIGLALAGIIAAWVVADTLASPDTEVSVLWGFVKYTKYASLSERPVSTRSCAIKIFDNITTLDTDSIGLPINKNYAPSSVRVNGQVSNAMTSYVYLIVDDDKGEWVQPGLGEHVDNEFAGNCYLGANNDAIWLNRFYTVSAVVTNKKYEVKDVIDRSTVVVQSNKIRLFRTH